MAPASFSRPSTSLRGCLVCVFALALASGALADAPAPSEAQPGWLAPAPAFGRVVINEIMYNERKKPGEGSTSARATKRANLRRARARAESAASDLSRAQDEARTKTGEENEKVPRFRVPAKVSAAAPAYGDARDDTSEALLISQKTPRRGFSADAPERAPRDRRGPPGAFAKNKKKGGDWIELHNPGSRAVSLEGWTLRGSRNGADPDTEEEEDDAFVVPRGLRGASLPPGGYLVLARDVARFKRRHADVPSVLDASFEFNLSAKGEMISLYDAGGRLVDFVEYDDGKGWPSSADGEGFSLELIDPVGVDRNDPFSWVSSAEVGGTPGRANGARAE